MTTSPPAAVGSDRQRWLVGSDLDGGARAGPIAVQYTLLAAGYHADGIDAGKVACAALQRALIAKCLGDRDELVERDLSVTAAQGAQALERLPFERSTDAIRREPGEPEQRQQACDDEQAKHAPRDAALEQLSPEAHTVRRARQ